jgi:hypothetical protein
MSVGLERSLFFEFIALQREIRFTGNPIFGKLGTGSVFGKKNQSPVQALYRRQDAIVLPR